MQLRDLSKPITTKILNENLARRYGYKLNLEEFSDVQLEDARNKLRTKLSQYELGESFDSVTESPEYQKTRLMLDCVNQAILEREEEKCPTCHADPCECEDEPMPKNKKKDKPVEETYVNKTFRSRAQELAVPSNWVENALKRIELGESDRAELKAELLTRYDLNESEASYVLLEGEEEKAEVIMATKDMVDRVTGWLEDVAAMKAEQLLELTDSIRESMGSDVAQQYTDAVKPALEAIYTALESSRQGISGGLSLVSGGEAPTMGAGPAAGAPGEAAMGGNPPPPGAEAGATPSSPEEEIGRMKRESIDYSRRLGILLASKKK
jgi:hypothetical protein